METILVLGMALNIMFVLLISLANFHKIDRLEKEIIGHKATSTLS